MTVAIIPSFNGRRLLQRNLPAVLAQSLPFARVIVVDDGSDDGSVAELRTHPGVEVVALAHNRGFAAAANAGVWRALADRHTRAIALINNDVELAPDWHRAAAAVLFADPRCGSCATCLLKANAVAAVDSAGITWRQPGWADNAFHGEPPPAGAASFEVVGASAGAALYRRELFEQVGLFDTSLVAYQEDVDLALRARRAGWRAALAVDARGLHQGSASNRPFPLGGTWADYWNARNRLPVLVASLDGGEWRRWWRPILASQLRFVVSSWREGRAAAVCAGSMRALTRLPGAFRKRRRASSSSTPSLRDERHLAAWSRISVVIITRDAAEMLPAALASIPEVAEVIVSDGGSRDDTVEIARSAGARVVPQDLRAIADAGGNFDIARNAAADVAGGDWVMMLDADERIPCPLAAEIATAVVAADADAYDMPRTNLFWGRPVRLLGEDRQLRLVRRGRGRYEGGSLHRGMVVDGSVAHLSSPLLHENVRRWNDVVRRFRRDVPIQAAATPAPDVGEVLRIPARMFRYYYVANNAWRDGLRGLAMSAAYACYHGAIAAAAWGKRRA